MVENAHKHLDREEDRVAAGETARPRGEVIVEAAKEVGPSLFFSLLIITVSFLPVFVLGGESGRLFKPLAFTKTFAMAAAAILSITIIPVLMFYFITSRVLPKSWGGTLNLVPTKNTASHIDNVAKDSSSVGSAYDRPAIKALATTVQTAR